MSSEKTGLGRCAERNKTSSKGFEAFDGESSEGPGCDVVEYSGGEYVGDVDRAGGGIVAFPSEPKLTFFSFPLDVFVFILVGGCISSEGRGLFT